MPPRKVLRGRKNKAKKPYTKPRAKRTSRVPAQSFKKMYNKMAEKKRFYIAPIALTNGDITCVAPITAFRNGGQVSSLIQPFPIGQQTAQSSTFGVTTIGGWSAFDITPYPIETNGFGGREGSSINLTSSYMQFKFTQMSANTLTPIKIRMTIVHVLGAPQSSGVALESYYLNSALPNGTGINNNNGIIDFNSSVSPDQRGQYKVIYNKTTTLWQDNIDAGLQVKQHLIKLKYNRGAGHIVRYLQNTTTPTNGQLIMFLTCDAGNVGPTTFTGAGQLTMVNNAIESGALCNFNICHYYTDP